MARSVFTRIGTWISDGQAGMSKKRDSADCEYQRQMRECHRHGASDFHRKSRTAAMARSIKSRTFWHWYHIIKEKVTVRLKQGQLERSGFG